MNDNNRSMPFNLENLDERKLKEIEHSRKRRSILQGLERHSDTDKSERVENLESVMLDKDEFDYNFSNMKFYSITNKSEEFQYRWLKERCAPDVKALDFACGNGENGIYAAQCGAEVIGIDISPEKFWVIYLSLNIWCNFYGPSNINKKKVFLKIIEFPLDPALVKRFPFPSPAPRLPDALKGNDRLRVTKHKIMYTLSANS